MKPRFLLAAAILAMSGLVFAAEVPYRADAVGDPLRSGVMQLLEDIERTRMLLGAAMWNVHDLRNFALYAHGREQLPAAEAQRLTEFDRESLRLYESIKPIDYAASSLLAALDLGDDRSAEGDLAFLRTELPPLASQVLQQYRRTAAAREAARRALTQQAAASGLEVNTIPGKPWDDPVRERQRRAGVAIGWRTNIEPPYGFREQFWDRLQKLDIRYQLKKGRMLGVTHLTFKDPVLRWDWIEQNRNRYDFSAFDRMMRLAIDNGYKVRLVIPTMGGGVPEWVVRQRPESVIRDEKGEWRHRISPKIYAHDFMGGDPNRNDSWYAGSSVNLLDEPTRQLFAKYVQALAEHCRRAGYVPHILSVCPDQLYCARHWRVPPGARQRPFIIEYFRRAAEIVRTAFDGVLIDYEVTDGEAHGIDYDYSAHEWRSAGLSELVSIPGVCSETPFFEDLMRAVAMQAARKREGADVEAGPFFYQNCEYGFGTMLSINYFTALLRDGLWSEGWFGPEGPLRWGYFPQIFTWNDRQLQWSGITNRYLGNRQAHLLGSTIANTRVAPADVLMLLPSSSMDVAEFRTHREMVGWAWALTALKVQYDVITEASLAAGVPERARLLILPQAVALSDEHVRAIRAFVRNGGTLIASMMPGTAGARPSPLADVLGCRLLRRDGKPVEVTQAGVKGTWLQVTVPRGLHSGKYTPVPAPDTGYPREFRNRSDQRQPYQVLEPAEGAVVVGEWGTGGAAIVDHRFGRGRALTMGYPYGNELVYADWTSIAFGKIYNGWARDKQMLAMVRWLRDELQRIGYQRPVAVPEAWRYRLKGFEAAVSSLAYPKGPALEQGKEFAFVQTYLDARPDHRIAEDHDIMDYAAELTWRDRPGVATRYLAVGNRESAYAGERASVQFWMMPHTFKIRINDPAVRQVYDVAAGAPVRLFRDDAGVTFYTTVPPALGRIYAVSTTNTIELFEPSTFPGLSFADLEQQVAALAEPARRPDRTVILDAETIADWLVQRSLEQDTITICCGDEAYRPAADKLAAALGKATVTTDDGTWEVQDAQQVRVSFVPSDADILIGNAWTNNTIATLDSTWPFNNGEAMATMAGRLTATYAWPGGDRGIVALTRARDFRNRGHQAFGICYGRVDGFVPVGVDTAPRPYQRRRLLVLASTPQGAMRAVEALARVKRRAPNVQDYARPGQLDPLPAGKASLYRVPWRSNQRTISAWEALQGVGVYYKHIPHTWDEAASTKVMKQMRSAGVRRLRLAPHHAIYIHKDWTQPKPIELEILRNELRACKAAGIRPCVVFVHIPPAGKPGTRELQDWWRQGELMPSGEVGSDEFNAFLDKVYLALTFVLNEARSAGFTAPDSWDLELGQGMWWGAPAVPRPWPSTTLADLKPGGRIYEFERSLIKRLRADGYAEPTVWWGMTHHQFEHCTDADVAPEAAGRAISFYSAWSGKIGEGWLGGDQYGPRHGPNDTWPVRPPLSFLEGAAPRMVLARPEGWMADRTRRDCLIELMRSSAKPVAVTSLGTVPSSIPEVQAGGLTGWEIKNRATGRSLAFWLNQGARFVLLHSAYEPRGAEMNHCVLPSGLDPNTFRWQDAPPLRVIHAFCEGLKGAKPIENPAELHFRFALEPDPVLFGKSEKGGPLRASDAVALLPFQIDDNEFAVAAYVVTPDVTRRMRPLKMTLQVQGEVSDAGVSTLQVSRQAPGSAMVVDRTGGWTTLVFDVRDDVTLLRFELK